MEWLTKLIASQPPAAHITGIAFVVGGALEILVGLVKTDKPVRIAFLFASILNGLGSLCTRWGEFLDKILPQNIKPPQV